MLFIYILLLIVGMVGAYVLGHLQGTIDQKKVDTVTIDRLKDDILRLEDDNLLGTNTSARIATRYDILSGFYGDEEPEDDPIYR